VCPPVASASRCFRGLPAGLARVRALRKLFQARCQNRSPPSPFAPNFRIAVRSGSDHEEPPGTLAVAASAGLFRLQVSGTANHPAAVLEEVIADTHPVFF
jgi:hypothetical protein